MLFQIHLLKSMMLFSRSSYLFVPAIVIASCMLLSSCDDHADKSLKVAAEERTTPAVAVTTQKDDVPNHTMTEVRKDSAIEVMDAEEIRLNGKLKRYFSIQQFTSVLGKADSSKLLRDEEPCSPIFQEPDGSVDPEAKYLYKNGSRYESSQGKVAIDEIRFGHGDFIEFHKNILNSSTTMNELRRLFPNAAKQIRVVDVAGEGKLEVIELREDKNNVSDGHINVFIKDGKLYSLQWWFPC